VRILFVLGHLRVRVLEPGYKTQSHSSVSEVVSRCYVGGRRICTNLVKSYFVKMMLFQPRICTNLMESSFIKTMLFKPSFVYRIDPNVASGRVHS
jgi:hypothetical protein